MLVAALLAACTPLGLTRGDYWTGTSTGDLGPCPAFEFELALADGAITGSATSQFPWGTALWEVRGQVSSRRVRLETRTDDPRVEQRSFSWTGTYNPVLWSLVQAPTERCPQRTVRLQRR
jgi:hypothetical protein